MLIDKQVVKPSIDRKYLILMMYYSMLLVQDQQLTLTNWSKKGAKLNFEEIVLPKCFSCLIN
jgi:hypothetical protein